MKTMTALPSHLWEFEGDLYSKRMANPYGTPLRTNYSKHHTKIRSVADLKATLRAGPFAWPGGYPLYFVTDDGAALSFDAVRSEFRRVAYSVRHEERDGWRVVACDINWEDAELYCEHTGLRIPSAYAE